jgi:siroheme synthase-like protein
MKKKPLCSYYPVFLNIRGRKCVVVGGGQVAWRKAKGLLERGADVEVISPHLGLELNALAEARAINVLRRHYQAGDLRGAFVAIAATSDGDTNREMVKEARRGGVLVNVVDDPENSDFIVPSCLQRGSMTIAIATAGKSPALARKIRTKLEKDFGEEYTALVNLIGEVRTELKRQGMKISGDDWQEALDLDLMIDLLKKGDVAKARAVLLDNLNLPKRNLRGRVS